MPTLRYLVLGVLALMAFAGNSLLNRAALVPNNLSNVAMDAGSFTIIRLASGAIMLCCIFAIKSVRDNIRHNQVHGCNKDSSSIIRLSQWRGGMALFIYAACFSYAYLNMQAGIGALILFTSVQLTMQGVALYRGERFSTLHWAGLVLAFAGLFWLLGLGASPPPFVGCVMMIISGVAWGLYSLLGLSHMPPIDATRSNFLWAAIISLGLLPFAHWASLDMRSVILAISAGAITSALGYVIWYFALPGLGVRIAAVGQLLVPSIAALGGVVFLNEGLTLRLVIASLLIIGGIALTLIPAKLLSK